MKAVVAATGVLAAEVWALLSPLTSPGGLATQIAVLSAGVAGLHWLWRNMLRPAAKILQRMAEAVEALEGLPVWRCATNRRIRHLELGLGQIASGQRALLRELGIEDKVRQEFSDPDTLERLLADFANEDDEELEAL